MPAAVSVLQSPHHLELHSSANSVGRSGSGRRLLLRCRTIDFLVKPARRAIVRKYSPRAANTVVRSGEKLMSASPVIDPAAPVKGPDIIDHLKVLSG